MMPIVFFVANYKKFHRITGIKFQINHKFVMLQYRVLLVIKYRCWVVYEVIQQFQLRAELAMIATPLSWNSWILWPSLMGRSTVKSRFCLVEFK